MNFTDPNEHALAVEMLRVEREQIALSYATGALMGELATGIEPGRAREAAERVVSAYLRITNAR